MTCNCMVQEKHAKHENEDLPADIALGNIPC